MAILVSGLFRAMGGDAMIGQSTINIMNGTRYRVSSTMSRIFMLLFVVALSPFINLLPVATLKGVLFMVVLSTFRWKTFSILRYGRLSDSIAVLLVTLIAVFFNLAIAIAAGVVFSALVHAWGGGTMRSSLWSMSRSRAASSLEARAISSICSMWRMLLIVSRSTLPTPS